ncbi:hypothetical protein TWF192_000528 [Orbilia oligospora]|nr:hypothetical protein TWF192_000528 [Orbilia oligospora]
MCIPHLEIFTEKREVEADVATGARVAQKKNKNASPVSSVPATIGSRGSKEIKFPIVVVTQPVNCSRSSTSSSSSSSPSSSSTSSPSSSSSARSSTDSSSSSSSDNIKKKESKKDRKYRYPSKSSRRPSNRLNVGHYKTNTDGPKLRPMTASDLWQVAAGHKTIHRLTPANGSGVPLDCLSDNGTDEGFVGVCGCETGGDSWGDEDKKSNGNGWGNDSGAGWGNDTKESSGGGWGGSNNGWGDDKKNSSGWGDDKKKKDEKDDGWDNDKDKVTWGDEKEVVDSDDGWCNDDKDDKKGKKGKNQGGNKKGKKGNKTDDEAEKSGNEKKGKGGKDKKGNAPGKHNVHSKHHHHHHEDDSTRAITVRIDGDFPEVINEEGSEITPLDSAHSPGSFRDTIPHITIATKSPGCACGGSTTTSSVSSTTTCPSCYIKQQTPRNYVQDLQGHWYRFAPGIDVDTYDKDDIFRGSDGRAYRRISSKKVPEEEFYHSRRNYGEHYGSRHHTHHQPPPPLGATKGQNYYPSHVPATGFMKFKKVFNKPQQDPRAAYQAAGAVPVYGIPVQPNAHHGRGSRWQGMFRLFTSSSNGRSTRHGNTHHHYKVDPTSSYDGKSRSHFSGYRPPDGQDGYGRRGD